MQQRFLSRQYCCIHAGSNSLVKVFEGSLVRLGDRFIIVIEAGVYKVKYTTKDTSDFYFLPKVSYYDISYEVIDNGYRCWCHESLFECKDNYIFLETYKRPSLACLNSFYLMRLR